VDRNNPICEIVARKVIEIDRAGFSATGHCREDLKATSAQSCRRSNRWPLKGAAPCVDTDQLSDASGADNWTMAQIDWVFVLSLLTLALSAGTVAILLFAI
jgi:hypothetical protein